VVSVGLNCIKRARKQLFDFGANGLYSVRIVRLESRKLFPEARFRLARPLLRQIEQAQGCVGQPVFQIPEGFLGSTRGAQIIDVAGLGEQRVGTELQLSVHEDVGADEDREQCAGQNDEAQWDRKARQPQRLEALQARRCHFSGRKRVMLMTPPRSPSLAPSFGYPVMSISPLVPP